MQRLTDLVGDLLIELSARRARVLLMLTAVALSTGALVMSIGISSTAARQIDSDIAATSTDRLTIQPVVSPLEQGDGAADSTDPRIFPEDAEERVTGIDTVRAAGLRLAYPDDLGVQRRDADQDTVALDHSSVVVFGATPGYLDAVGADAASAWMLDRGETYRVALLGKTVAEQLDIPADVVDLTGYRIYVGSDPYEVVGVVAGAERVDLDNAVILPYSRVLDAARGSDSQAQLFVHTAPGAGGPVSDVVLSALRPDAPQKLKVSTVVDMDSLRTGVSTQLSRLAGAIGLLLLALTALLIANSMVVAVVARTAEIGLRRALGASRGAIANLFLADGALTGALGGLMGSGLASAAIVGVASVNGWTAGLSVWYLLAGPILGAVIGLLASAYPAARAARISPAEAVRAE